MVEGVPFLTPFEDVCRRLLVADRSGMICFDVLLRDVGWHCVVVIYCICALFVIIRGEVRRVE